jgi:hypothetical protein
MTEHLQLIYIIINNKKKKKLTSLETRLKKAEKSGN